MANQYHDETGRFCSADEMKAAVDRVQKSGDFNAYFKIRQDYELIAQNKMIVSEELIKSATSRSYNPGLATITDPNHLEEAYSLWLIGEEEDRNIFGLSLIFNNPNTPKHVLQDIAEVANEKEATKLLEEYNLGLRQNAPHVSSEVYEKLAEKISDYNLYPVISENRSLTFEQKFNFLKERPLSLVEFARYESNNFAKNLELREELHTAIDNVKTDQAGVLTLSTTIKSNISEETTNKILDKLEATDSKYLDVSYVAAEAIRNEGLTLNNLRRLNEFIANKDFTASKDFIQYLAYARDNRSTDVTSFRRTLADYSYRDKVTYLNSDFVARHPELYKIASEAMNVGTPTLRGNLNTIKLQAVYDLEPNNAKELKKLAAKAKGSLGREYLDRIDYASKLIMSDTLTRLLDKAA